MLPEREDPSVNVPIHSVLLTLLSLSDPLMADRADYNVLLATTGVPLHRQGLNDLGHTFTVSLVLMAWHMTCYYIHQKRG